MEVKQLIKIKIVDGIPYIVLEDDDIWTEARLKHKAKELQKWNFTDCQQEKHRKYFNQIKEELKKKFGEK
jgi:hypothetical protein